MDLLHAIAVAILQGATELFPVSSLGHAVVLPAVFGMNLDERAPSFLPFLVMLHLGTATALLLYFWRDWWALARGVIGLDAAHQVRESRRVLALIVIATLPAVIIGFAFEHFFRDLFASPMVAAAPGPARSVSRRSIAGPITSISTKRAACSGRSSKNTAKKSPGPI